IQTRPDPTGVMEKIVKSKGQRSHTLREGGVVHPGKRNSSDETLGGGNRPCMGTEDPRSQLCDRDWRLCRCRDEWLKNNKSLKACGQLLCWGCFCQRYARSLGQCVE